MTCSLWQALLLVVQALIVLVLVTVTALSGLWLAQDFINLDRHCWERLNGCHLAPF